MIIWLVEQHSVVAGAFVVFEDALNSIKHHNLNRGRELSVSDSEDEALAMERGFCRMSFRDPKTSVGYSFTVHPTTLYPTDYENVTLPLH